MVKDIEEALRCGRYTVRPSYLTFTGWNLAHLYCCYNLLSRYGGLIQEYCPCRRTRVAHKKVPGIVQDYGHPHRIPPPLYVDFTLHYIGTILDAPLNDCNYNEHSKGFFISVSRGFARMVILLAHFYVSHFDIIKRAGILPEYDRVLNYFYQFSKDNFHLEPVIQEFMEKTLVLGPNFGNQTIALEMRPIVRRDAITDTSDSAFRRFSIPPSNSNGSNTSLRASLSATTSDNGAGVGIEYRVLSSNSSVDSENEEDLRKGKMVVDR